MILAPGGRRDARASRRTCWRSCARRASRACASTARVHDLDTAPRLAKNVKHSVDVVIDRLRARADAEQRSPSRSRRRCATPTGAPLSLEPTPAGAPVLGQVRLPGVRLRAARARAAPVLLQQPDGRLPALRRPGRDRVLRPEAHRRAPEPVARRAARSAAGTAATTSTTRCCSSLARHYGFDVEQPWEMLEDRVQQPDPRRLGQGEDRLPVPLRARPHHGARSMPSRA